MREKFCTSDLFVAVRSRNIVRLKAILDSGIVLSVQGHCQQGGNYYCPSSTRPCSSNKAVLLTKHSNGFQSNNNNNSNDNDCSPMGCCSARNDPLLECCRSPGYLVCQEMAILLIRYGAPMRSWCLLSRAMSGRHDDLAEYILEATSVAPPRWVARDKGVPLRLRVLCESYRCARPTRTFFKIV